MVLRTATTVEIVPSPRTLIMVAARDGGWAGYVGAFCQRTSMAGCCWTHNDGRLARQVDKPSLRRSALK